MNTRVKDNRLKHYLIGDGLHEITYLSFNSDILNNSDDNAASRITPYSKFAPLSIINGGVKLEEGKENHSYQFGFKEPIKEEAQS